jgi:hypothetical protein
MKWFSHDSGLRNTPMMRGIRHELGEAGFSRAMILLEVLAENGGMTDDFCPELSLEKPQSDVTFWAREFDNISVAEVEKTLATFQKFELIIPFKESKTVCAPMLSDRLDEFTRRKRSEKARGSKRGSRN